MAWFTGVSLALTAAGSYLSARNQWKAGDAEQRAGEAERRAAYSQADLAEYNAAVAEIQAKDAQTRGKIEADRFRARTRVFIGEQRAGIAATNVDVGFGSAVDVQADTAFLGELDALTIRTNAAREAWGFRVEATDLRKRAQIARLEGDAAAEAGGIRRSASRWGAAGTILSTGASLLESRYGFGRGKGAH
jgi:hypothetical protein